MYLQLICDLHYLAFDNNSHLNYYEPIHSPFCCEQKKESSHD